MALLLIHYLNYHGFIGFFTLPVPSEPLPFCSHPGLFSWVALISNILLISNPCSAFVATALFWYVFPVANGNSNLTSTTCNFLPAIDAKSTFIPDAKSNFLPFTYNSHPASVTFLSSAFAASSFKTFNCALIVKLLLFLIFNPNSPLSFFVSNTIASPGLVYWISAGSGEPIFALSIPFAVSFSVAFISGLAFLALKSSL